MIEYSRGPYGANLLLRWHGSALAKAFLPGLLSVGVYLALRYSGYSGVEEDRFDHPYAVGVLVTSVTFLIIFRANYGYQRYWEACTMVHKLMSKWLDFTHFIGVFHLRDEHFKVMRPPSFYHHEDLNELNLTRGRERYSAHHHFMIVASGSEDALGSIDPGSMDSPKSSDSPPNLPGVEGARSVMMANMKAESRRSLRRRRYVKSINQTVDTRDYTRTQSDAAAEPDETHLLGPPRLDGGWASLFPNEVSGEPTATYCDISKGVGASQIPQTPDPKGFASMRGGRTPSLFLQELAHLSSLLCAVAFTTLRNDLDDVESPLGVYVPGQPWPVADPVNLPKEVKVRAYDGGRLARNAGYLLGIDQTRRSRTIYNAARPMLVIGGVSDNEVAFLQRARGPYAKTQLAWSWLSEFMIREHLAGSLGDVGSPILSRIVQFLGDGMLYYNHARKIMYTPFPFPHAQLSAFFVLTMMVAIPFLMEQYANQAWLGASLSFLTVTCLAGLHEVARELENPFRNAPNDVPLCTLLGFYNEALVTMFAGYHPDAYWEEADVLTKGRGVALRDGGRERVNGDNGGNHSLLMPELPVSGENGNAKGEAQQKTNNRGLSLTPIPQSVDDVDSLKELVEIVDSQASKIKELQERMRKKGDGGSCIHTASGYVLESTLRSSLA